MASFHRPIRPICERIISRFCIYKDVWGIAVFDEHPTERGLPWVTWTPVREKIASLVAILEDPQLPNTVWYDYDLVLAYYIIECVDRKNQKGRLTICCYALVGQALNNLLSVSSRFSPPSSRNTSININPLIYFIIIYISHWSIYI